MPPKSVFLRSSFASPSGRVSSSGSSVHPPPPPAIASLSGRRESVQPSRVHPPCPSAVVRPSGSSPCSGRSPLSTRKRQSVVCRYPNRRLVLYCKGADNVIYERLVGTNQDIKRLTREHLEQFGSSRLRTLCLAYRDLTIDTYENWNEKFVQAKSSLRDREKKLDEVAEMIEKDLILIGCIAIEDKLQEGVLDCIDTLSRAGIKIWVLTG